MVITMAFEDYPPEVRAKLEELGNAAAEAAETQDVRSFACAEDDPDFSPELEISRLLNRRKAELDYIDGRITRMVLLMHRRGRSWESIGRELGITGEAARLRYAKLEKPQRH